MRKLVIYIIEQVRVLLDETGECAVHEVEGRPGRQGVDRGTGDEHGRPGGGIQEASVTALRQSTTNTAPRPWTVNRFRSSAMNRGVLVDPDAEQVG